MEQRVGGGCGNLFDIVLQFQNNRRRGPLLLKGKGGFHLSSSHSTSPTSLYPVGGNLGGRVETLVLVSFHSSCSSDWFPSSWSYFGIPVGMQSS